MQMGEWITTGKPAIELDVLVTAENRVGGLYVTPAWWDGLHWRYLNHYVDKVKAWRYMPDPYKEG